MPRGATTEKERPMCHDLDSSPPIPVIAGAAVSHEDLVLDAADGNRFAAFAATPDEPSDVGVVILPDVRGLYRFYEELALRFAERGYPAVAIDYFGRTAGVDKRDDEFPFMDHVAQTTPGGRAARRRRGGRLAALARGRRRAPASSRSASASAGATRGSPPPAATSWPGAIGFYGMPGERNGQPGPDRSAPARSARRSWRSRPAPTRTSPPRTTRRSTPR